MFPSIRVCEELPLPRMARVTRKFPDERIEDLDAVVSGQIRACVKGLQGTANPKARVREGDRIAIAVGSRGIARLADIVASTVAELRRLGAVPFIVPGMGSHGGGTPEGQKAVLAEYGVTEQTVGAEIISSMEVTEVGCTRSGVRVYFDKAAFSADGVVPINRIKKHTDFHGPIESGLMKMMAIGLGKIRGATEIHKVGPPLLPTVIPEVAETIIARCPILFGIGVVENAYGHISRVEAIPKDSIRESEERLLTLSKELSPVIPVDADVLIIDEMGKDISGCGMDTNVIGRIRIMGVEEPKSPKISRIVVLDMTHKSEGNASGLGVADFTTKRLADKIDFAKFYTNEVASAMSERGKLPMALATDRDAIKAGLLCCWLKDPSSAKVIRIKNTMTLDDFYVSESLIPEITRVPGVVSIGAVHDIGFDADGSIMNTWASASAEI